MGNRRILSFTDLIRYIWLLFDIYERILYILLELSLQFLTPSIPSLKIGLFVLTRDAHATNRVKSIFTSH